MAPPKRPWFRFYVEAVYDGKLRRLPPAQRWLWVVVLAVARQSPVSGFLLLSVDGPAGTVTNADLADASGLKESEVVKGLAAMERVGMIRRDGSVGSWEVVNWADRQYESDDVAKRTRRHRSKTDDGTPMERSINGDSPPDGTPPENREQRTETEARELVGSSTVVAPSAAPLKARLSEPRGFVELVEPSGPVAIRREAGAVLDEASRIATCGLLPQERSKLFPVIGDALQAGYDPRELAEAVASSPFRTRDGVMGELRKRKQPLQTRKSVGDTGLSAAANWVQRQEGA